MISYFRYKADLYGKRLLMSDGSYSTPLPYINRIVHKSGVNKGKPNQRKQMETLREWVLENAYLMAKYRDNESLLLNIQICREELRNGNHTSLISDIEHYIWHRDTIDILKE